MITGILIEGLIYGIMVRGVFMTFRVLNFCDMTVDGAFPMGACVLAACLTHGISPALALLIAFSAGLLAGFFTTLIYTKLRVPDLLAGHKAYRSMGMIIAFVNHIRQKASYPALPPRMAIHFL